MKGSESQLVKDRDVGRGQLLKGRRLLNEVKKASKWMAKVWRGQEG